MNAVASSLGVLRSFLIYYGIPMRAARLRRFYAQFVPPGGLCFDVGAHLGNRVRAWRALGARVVAIEPHPDLLHVLRALYGRDAGVTIVAAALGARDGEAPLWVCPRNPTVTTLSQDWIQEVQQDVGFQRIRWQLSHTVQLTTLNALIKSEGVPDFVKIDVEGFEAEVLKGLDTAVPCLSFEYLPAARHRALACLDHLESLGDYRYNWSVGESHRLARAKWYPGDEIRRVIQALASDAGAGDIYARLRHTV
jgi:FkbM family methyltransferase